MSTLNETPRANRLHIGVFGRRNAGKSTIVNAICGHGISVVSDVAGTTTDPVYKSIELHGLGPCVIIDTAGLDDEGALGGLRIEKTLDALDKTDVALLLFPADADGYTAEAVWAAKIAEKKIPVIAVVSRADLGDAEAKIAEIKEKTNLDAFVLSGDVRQSLIAAVLRVLPHGFGKKSLTAHLVNSGDSVLLVMPQDIQAPQGRLILPQVQTIRDLLDNHAIVTCTTVGELDAALQSMKEPPKLIITDSQAFGAVYEKKPPKSRLTSFSILLAAAKGDIDEFRRGARAIKNLNANSRVLIAEACTHAPLEEDIGREKIPRMLRKRYGDMRIDIVSGSDFPKDLSPYDLIVHCGACMFNRKYMMSRVDAAKEAGVPITNYGVLLAELGGILDKVEN